MTITEQPNSVPSESDTHRGTFVGGLNEALHYAMREDSRVLVMGEDVATLGGLFRVTAGLLEAFPGRVIDTPICEGGFVGVGIGAAMAGHAVIVEMQVIDFLLFAADQLANAGNLHFVSGAQLSVPIVVRGPCGLGTGFGVTHSQRLEAIFAGRPGLKVLMPSTPADAKGLLTSAIADPSPVVIFEGATLYYAQGDLPPDGTTVPIGAATVVLEGDACTVATAGRGVGVCLEAAETLRESHGIAIEIIDLRSLKPVDWKTIDDSVTRTRRFIATLDGPGFCSYSSYLTAQIAQRWWTTLISAPRTVGGLDVAGSPSLPAEGRVCINPSLIVEEVKAMIA